MPRLSSLHEGGLQLMTVSVMILLAECGIIGLAVGWITRGLWDEWKWGDKL